MVMGTWEDELSCDDVEVTLPAAVVLMVVVGTGTSVGAWLGSPEKVGTACGVANI
jgi:Flp pilus assembly pilin Flp